MDDELGNALVLMHRARRSLTTLECTLWTWAHRSRSSAALERSGGTTIIGYRPGHQGPARIEDEGADRLWHVAPDRLRREHDYGVELDLGGERWSISHDPSTPIIRTPARVPARGSRRTYGHRDVLESMELLADPRLLAFGCELESIGTGEVDGRPTIDLAATPRDDVPEPTAWAFEIPLRGADRVVTSIDRELGLAIRVELQLAGSAFQIEELRDLQVGHHISAARFDPTPELEGREVLTPEEMHERLRAERGGSMVGMPRPHHHEPTGPGPEDEDAATAAIQAALDALFGPRGDDLAGVEGGEGLGPILDLARERNAGLIQGDFSVRLGQTRFVHARLAEIECRTVAGGMANGQPLSGFAFEQDGRWLISRETLARLLSMGGVSLPPRTVGLDPG
jgi:hypothetical protein